MIKTRCPICHQEMQGPQSEWPHFPFCSRRCRLIDLGRWLKEEYTLPTDEPEDVPPEEGETGDAP
jgi:uncharacterized protein